MASLSCACWTGVGSPARRLALPATRALAGMTEESAAAADPLLGAEEARREKLKKAGEAYFEKILAGQRARDPPLPASKPASGPKADGAAVPFDDTFHTVGAVVESALVKQYVLGTVYVACQAAGLVFAKVGGGRRHSWHSTCIGASFSAPPAGCWNCTDAAAARACRASDHPS